jgi:hypothetical protein
MLLWIYGSLYMELIEQLAQAALKRDSLQLRSLVQDWVRSGRPVSELKRPTTQDAPPP